MSATEIISEIKKLPQPQQNPPIPRFVPEQARRKIALRRATDAAQATLPDYAGPDPKMTARAERCGAGWSPWSA